MRLNNKFFLSLAFILNLSIANAQSIGPTPGGATACSGLLDAGPFCSGTNAASLTGTISSAQINGTYAGITGVGNLVSGTVPLSLITNLGTGVPTALGVNVGSAGAFVILNGALGTPSSGVATNLTGTAAGLTAGTVTTNANLTGDVSSVGNVTTCRVATTSLTGCSKLGAFLNAKPPNQTISSTSTLMMGLGSSCFLTPTKTGNILVSISGYMVPGTNAESVSLFTAYGTGSAPANGAAATGTVVGNPAFVAGASTIVGYGWASVILITGLTVGTSYWFDYQVADSTSTLTSYNNLNCALMEQ